MVILRTALSFFAINLIECYLLKIVIIIIFIGIVMNTYIHTTNQRVRVRSDFIKENDNEVSLLISQLEKIDAITSVKYKKYAGSVAITFDENELDSDSVLEILEGHGWLRSNPKPSFIENAVVSGTKTFAKGMAGVALSRLVGPSISRVIMSL